MIFFMVPGFTSVTVATGRNSLMSSSLLQITLFYHHGGFGGSCIKRRYSRCKAGTTTQSPGLGDEKEIWDSWCFYIEMNKVICSE